MCIGALYTNPCIYAPKTLNLACINTHYTNLHTQRRISITSQSQKHYETMSHND